MIYLKMLFTFCRENYRFLFCAGLLVTFIVLMFVTAEYGHKIQPANVPTLFKIYVSKDGIEMIPTARFYAQRDGYQIRIMARTEDGTVYELGRIK